MATSAQTTNGFVDPYSYTFGSGMDLTGREQYGDMYNYNYDSRGGNNEVGIPGFFRKLFGEDVDELKYQRHLAEQQAYERASIDSARAWSEYMDNTAVQRRVKDLEAAGLNPWLAVQNGISGSGAPSVDTGGSAQVSNSSNQSSNGLLYLIVGLAKLLLTKGSSGKKDMTKAVGKLVKK